VKRTLTCALVLGRVAGQSQPIQTRDRFSAAGHPVRHSAPAVQLSRSGPAPSTHSCCVRFICIKHSLQGKPRLTCWRWRCFRLGWCSSASATALIRRRVMPSRALNSSIHCSFGPNARQGLCACERHLPPASFRCGSTGAKTRSKFVKETLDTLYR
jgi:hypothetical protein